MRAAILLAAATGCSGSADDADDEPPHPVEYAIGGQSTFPEWAHAFPPPIAVGGTQRIHVSKYGGDSASRPLQLQASVDGVAVSIDQLETNGFTLHGLQAGQATLTITDGSNPAAVFHLPVIVTHVDTAELVVVDDLLGGPVVWMTGDQTKIGVSLLQGSDVVVDDSLQISLAGSNRVAWNEVELVFATAGSYPLAVTAAGLPTKVFVVVVVDHVDSVALESGPPMSIHRLGDDFCFVATTQGKAVAGAPWTFAVTNAAWWPQHNNCIRVEPGNGPSVTISAFAGGKTVSFTVTVL
jgi:hypothetical protein